MFHAARNHKNGPGAWCLRSDKNIEFEIDLGNRKDIAYFLAEILNGNNKELIDYWINRFRVMENGE